MLARMRILLAALPLAIFAIGPSSAVAYPSGPRPACKPGQRPTVVNQTVPGSKFTCRYKKETSYSGAHTDQYEAFDIARRQCRAKGSRTSAPQDCEVQSNYACAQATTEAWACQ